MDIYIYVYSAHVSMAWRNYTILKCADFARGCIHICTERISMVRRYIWYDNLIDHMEDLVVEVQHLGLDLWRWV